MNSVDRRWIDREERRLAEIHRRHRLAIREERTFGLLELFLVERLAFVCHTARLPLVPSRHTSVNARREPLATTSPAPPRDDT
jgi:hypothetical protein